MMKETLTFRLATEKDLLPIIRMLADDTLGATREKVEDSVLKTYEKAFQRIVADPNQELTVAEMNGEIVATFHLTFIQYLTHRGGLRAQIEATLLHRLKRSKSHFYKFHYQFVVQKH